MYTNYEESKQEFQWTRAAGDQWPGYAQPVRG